MMHPSQNAINLIKSKESFSPIPYPCPSKVWTIGFGHAILPNEHFTVITEEQGEQLLLQDMSIAANCINQNVKVPLTQNQFDAMVSFVFNIGCDAFLKSTMLELLNHEQ
jgi:lysozyme